MKVTLHLAAEQDISEAATFYEREGTPILAARFVAELSGSRHCFLIIQKSARRDRMTGAVSP